MSEKRSIPTAPGKLFLFGHLLPFFCKRLHFLESLRPLGEIVEIWLGVRKTYVITSPELIYQVLVTDSAKFEKGLVVEKVRRVLGNGVGTSNGAFHLRQRRLMQPAFHRSRIAEYIGKMRERTQAAIESWGNEDSLLPTNEFLFTLALDILTETLLPSNIKQGPRLAMQASIRPILDGVLIHTLMPELFRKFPFPVNRRFNQAADEFRKIIGDILSQNSAALENGTDLLSTLIMATDSDDSSSMSQQQLHDEVVTLFFAGVETVSNVMTWLFYEISRNPRIQEKLHAELDEVLHGRDVTADDIPNMHYTQCIVKEALRLYTPAWLLMRRAIAEAQIGPLSLSPGDETMFSPTMVHRDASLYDKPMAFNPDRWLTDHAKTLPRNAFIAFGGGATKCIGEAFAWSEMVVITATICARYYLHPSPGNQVREIVSVLMRPSPVVLTVSARIKGLA